ncbi:MAG TPA: hypothetical protein VER12_14570 [Polyangiaceae bacterium]|nr:hypothetical protein [Polyangiaceae bacterium]
MGDPLITLYRDSFQTQHPLRKLHEELDAAKLRKASEQIQSTGQPASPPLPLKEIPRFTKLPTPEAFFLPLEPPASLSEQMEVLKRQELERLIKEANAPSPVPFVPAPLSTTPLPSSMAQEFEQLKRQEAEKWRKVTEKLWEAERAELSILFQLYEQMVRAEYLEIQRFAKAQFQEFEERGGGALYAQLRPIYFRAKVREPHKFIIEMEQPGRVRLAGKVVQQGMHKKFAAIIDRVNQKLNSSIGGNPDATMLRYVGSFRPQPLGSRPSNHMFGAAIDVDSSTNPHLKAPQVAVLERLLEFRAQDAAKKNPLQPAPTPLRLVGSWLADVPKIEDIDDLEKARRFYAKMLQISAQTKEVLHAYLEEWQQSRKSKSTPADPQKQKAFAILDDMAKHFGGVSGLRDIQQRGFISIPAEVFEALVSDPQLQWGKYTDLHPGQAAVDIMHFEVRPQVLREEIIGPNGFP